MDRYVPINPHSYEVMFNLPYWRSLHTTIISLNNDIVVIVLLRGRGMHGYNKNLLAYISGMYMNITFPSPFSHSINLIRLLYAGDR